MTTLDGWKERMGITDNTFVGEVQNFLRNVTWELVDGQHILNPCIEIVIVEQELMQHMPLELYSNRFGTQPATVVVYNKDPTFYVCDSRLSNIQKFTRT